MLQPDPLLDPARHRLRMLRRPDAERQPEEAVEMGNEQRILIERGQAAQHAGKRGFSPLEAAIEQRQIAQRHGVAPHPQIDDAQPGDHGQHRQGIRRQFDAGAMPRQRQPAPAQPASQLPVLPAQLVSISAQADFLGERLAGQQQVEIARIALGHAVGHPPSVPAARVPDPRQRARQGGREQDRQQEPLGNPQHAHHRTEHDRAAAQLHQISHDARGARHRLGLRHAHLVVIGRGLVAGQIHFDGFLLERILHMVRHRRRLGVGDDGRERAANPPGQDHRHHPRRQDEQAMGVAGPGRLRQEPARRIHHLARQHQRRHGQHALRRDDQRLERRPSPRAIPHQADRLAQMPHSVAMFLHGLRVPAAQAMRRGRRPRSASQARRKGRMQE